MDSRLSFKKTKAIFIAAFNGFNDDNLTKLAGSLAYSTIFSLGPLLIIIISLCSIFFGKDAVEGKIYAQLASFVGSDVAIQLQQIIKSAAINGRSNVAIVIGGIILLIGATAIFNEIQSSINLIWGLKPKPKKGWLKILQNRFLSFSVIIGLGFLLLVSLCLNAIIDGFSDKIQLYFHNVTIIVFYIINILLTFIITVITFGVIFKVLPDANIKWKDVFGGAIATAVFFMLGKLGISLYISKSHVGTTYGATGSLIILLLWIYYSSIILYFGAELTKAYAIHTGTEIKPSQYAVATKMVEEEKKDN
jgi:membrane protein